MSSLNKATLIGNLGADPEIRYTQDGKPIASLSIATSDKWHDRATGIKKERTEWHRVSVFNEGLCKIIENYVRKGSRVYVEGKLQTRKWQDQNGHERYSTEITLQPFDSKLVLLDGPRGTNQPDNTNAYAQSETSGTDNTSGNSASYDDEIPF